jgi:hypothetical protein
VQALSTVLAQAVTLMAIALVVALPVGWSTGRFLWVRTARWLGIADDPSVPLGQLGLLGVAALAGAAVIALLPGVLAASIRPAVALRSE